MNPERIVLFHAEDEYGNSEYWFEGINLQNEPVEFLDHGRWNAPIERRKWARRCNAIRWAEKLGYEVVEEIER